MKVQNKWFRLLTLAILIGFVGSMVSYGMEQTGDDEFTTYFKELSKEGVLPKELQHDIRRLQLLKDVLPISLLKPFLEIEDNSAVTALAFSDPALVGNKIVIASGYDGNFTVYNAVSIWALDTREELHRLLENEKLVNAIAIAGDKMATGSDKVRIWDINTGELLRTFKAKKHLWVITSVAIAGNKVIGGSNSGDTAIWDMNTGELLNVLEGKTQWGVNSVAAVGDKVVTGQGWGDAKIWDINTGALLHTLEGRINSVTSHTFEGHTNSVTSVAIVGDRVITGSADKTAKIWDINTGQLLHTLEGHKKLIRSVAAADDKVVTGSFDKTAKVWNINTGKLLYTIVGHTGRINSVAISNYIASSGKRNYIVATGSDDKNTMLWALPPGSRGSPNINSVPWMIEQATIPQLYLIKRAYNATVAGENFGITFPSEDAVLFVSFPAHVRKYLLERLNITLKK